MANSPGVEPGEFCFWVWRGCVIETLYSRDHAASCRWDAARCRCSGRFKGDFAAGAAIWRQDQFLNKFKELSRTQLTYISYSDIMTSCISTYAIYLGSLDFRFRHVTMLNQTPSDLLPLPVSQMHILLALTTGDKHGYAIMKEVELFTEGAVMMGPGTLYGAVKQMLKAGLIDESSERPDPDLDDERRRYYRLTDLGLRTLDAEVYRIEQLARTARSRRTDAMSRLGV